MKKLLCHFSWKKVSIILSLIYSINHLGEKKSGESIENRHLLNSQNTTLLRMHKACTSVCVGVDGNWELTRKYRPK